MSLYKALNEDEVMKARFDLLQDGEYEAVVKSVTHKLSSTGNVMADMTLSVFDKEGNSHEVRDFLVFTPKMLWKIKHFCDSSGQTKIYEEEKFEPIMASQQYVKVKVSTQTGNEIPFDKLNGKPEGSRYPDRNVIDDYVLNTKIVPTPADDFINDPIPF